MKAIWFAAVLLSAAGCGASVSGESKEEAPTGEGKGSELVPAEKAGIRTATFAAG